MRIDITLNDWQARFFHWPIENKRHANYGEFRSGKTTTIGLKIASQIIPKHGDVNGAIVRNVHPDLMKSTIPQFKKIYDWDLTGERFNKTDKILYLHDKGMVFFMALDRPDDVKKLKNIEIGWYWVEQAEEVPEEIHNMLEGRLSQEPRWGCISGNPEGKQWDYYKYFAHPAETVIGTYKGQTIEKGVFRGETDRYMGLLPPPFLNEKNLPEGYYDDLIRTHSTEWCDKYVFSKFGGHAGLVHKDFDPKRHVIQPDNFYEIHHLWQNYEGMDYGVSNPTCWLFGAYRRDTDTIIIYDEYYVAGQNVNFHAPKINLKRSEYRQPLLTVGCPRAFQTESKGRTPADEYLDNQIVLEPFPIGLEARVEIVNRRFKQNKIEIFSRCHYLIRQLEGQTWKNVKSFENHALEAFQRLVAKIDSMTGHAKPDEAFAMTRQYNTAETAGLMEMSF